MDWRAQLAVVTGGTEGIGRATVEALAERGAAVAFCARTGAKAEALARDLAARGTRALGLASDVRESEQVGAFAHRVLAEFGTPTILVNNAGIARWGSVAEMSLEDWDAVIGTNVTGLFLVTRAFLPAMLKAGGGTIVNVSSLAGRNGIANGAAYSASKHAVLGFSKSLMLEVRRQGVRVVAVCPGSVDTPIFEKDQAPFPVDRAGMMAPDDVAQAILDAVALPPRAMVSELDIRPTNP